MDADAVAVRDVNEFGEELFELGRPCALDLVGSFRNEVSGVFEGWDGDRLFLVEERKGHRAGDGLAFLAGSCESECYHRELKIEN